MEEDEIKILSTEDIYTSLLTPEDHYTELNPAMVPCNNQSNAQSTNSPGSILDSTTKSFKTKVHWELAEIPGFLFSGTPCI